MARQRARLADPTDLKFELVDEKIPAGLVQVNVEVFTFFHLLSFCLSKIVPLPTDKRQDIAVEVCPFKHANNVTTYLFNFLLTLSYHCMIIVLLLF